MQTQRTILWVIFTMSVLFLWDAWQAHSGKPTMFHGAPKTTQPAPVAGTPAAPAAGATVPASAGVPNAPVATVPGAAPAASPATAQPPVRLKTDVLALDIDPVGGEVQRAELLKFNDPDAGAANMVLFDERSGHTYVAQTGLASPSLPNHRTPFTVVDGPRELADGQNTLELKMSAEQGGVRLTRTYRLTRGSYAVDVRTEVSNLGEATIKPVLYMQITRDKVAPQNVAGIASHFVPIGSFGPVFFTDAIKFKKVDFAAVDKKPSDEIARDVTDGWAGMMQHYFVSAWVPQKDAVRTLEVAKVEPELYVARIRQALPEIAPAATVATDSVLYVGPQDQRVLEKIAPGLDLVVDYGWLTVIAKPIFELLQFLYGLVANWGWAIVLLTLIIKFAFFPLQAASYRSMAKMKKVAPKLQQLRERFGSDKAKMNQAMMELYKTEKINPLGGCLPIVVQIPVFIALYYVLFASVELRGAPWLGWIHDLASPDPFYILPALMAISMFVQTKLNPTPPDPLQAKMMLWMPLIFSVMFFFFPAGLVLYWLVNNLFSIAQQWYITRRIEGKPVFGRAPA